MSFIKGAMRFIVARFSGVISLVHSRAVINKTCLITDCVRSSISFSVNVYEQCLPCSMYETRCLARSSTNGWLENKTNAMQWLMAIQTSLSRRQVLWQPGKVHLNSTVHVHVPLCWQHYRRILISYMLCASTSFGRHSIVATCSSYEYLFRITILFEIEIQTFVMSGFYPKKKQSHFGFFFFLLRTEWGRGGCGGCGNEYNNSPLCVFSAAMTVLAIQNPFWDSY